MTLAFHARRLAFGLVVLLLCFMFISPFFAQAEAAVTGFQLSLNQHSDGTQSIVVSWSQNQETNFLKYVVYLDDRQIAELPQAPEVGYPVSILKGGQNFRIRVDAVDSGGQHYASASGVIYAPASLSVDLPSWVKPAGYAYKPGESLLSFTPSVPGARLLQVTLPFVFGESTAIDNMELSADDLTLTDSTGTKIALTRANEGLLLRTGMDLVSGHTYTLSMSSTSGGREIRLPKTPSTDAALEVRLLSWDSKILEQTFLGRFQLVDGSWMQHQVDGKVILEPEENQAPVPIPLQAAELMDPATSSVLLDRSNASLELPKETLRQIQSGLPKDRSYGAQIELGFSRVNPDQTAWLLIGGRQPAPQETVTLSGAFQFSLTSKTANGDGIPAATLIKPATMRIRVDVTGIHPMLLGIYELKDDSPLTYVGGRLKGSYLEAPITHPGIYIALAARTNYRDLGGDHPAYEAVQWLTTRKVISGVGGNTFAPESSVTRAQFAIMLARGLGLTSNRRDLAFLDVDRNAYYFQAVAAAYEAGIIQGRSEDLFAPEETVSREEMAVMLMRAYAYARSHQETAAHPEAAAKPTVTPAAGGAPAPTAELTNPRAPEQSAAASTAEPTVFVDNDAVHFWAADAVEQAVRLQIMAARENGLFAPLAAATRAECAMAIAQLLLKLE